MSRLKSRRALVALAVFVAGVTAAAFAAVTAQSTNKVSWPKPPLGNSWQDYFGLQPQAGLNASGPKALDPKPGQLYFYTNSGTAYVQPTGTPNTRNSVVVFNATDMKNWKVVAKTNLPDEYALGYTSHGVGVSADGRWIYLGADATAKGKQPLVLVLDGFTLKPAKVYKETIAGFGPHHATSFTGPDGREYVMMTDFSSNFIGAGAYVFDPEKDHAIVGGVSRYDLAGSAYFLSGDVAGKFMLATVPPASSALRGKQQAVLDKLDLSNWKVVGTVALRDALWAETTQDGKIAWVTEPDPSKVAKVDLEKMQVLDEISSGAGPYGSRLSYDESQLWVANYGSGGYGGKGRTITVIDTKSSSVIDVLASGEMPDHLILSPDGKYIVSPSNVDHTLSIYDTKTRERVAIVKTPDNGDPHGGTFVQWKSDGKGGVIGEVVSDVTGLRGSARAAQQAFLKTAPATPTPATPTPTQPATPAPAGRVQQVKIVGADNQWNIKTLAVKVGTQVRFTLTNRDEEPHNLINAKIGLTRANSPDVTTGRTATFLWKVPNKPGVYKVICTYHPWMVVKTTIKK